MRKEFCLTLLFCLTTVITPAHAVEFAVNTKFAQGANLEYVDHLLRTGVKANRDAVIWRSVETEKGVLQWSERNNLIFSTLKTKGIRTTVLIHGVNKHYDQGLFPTSPDAVAAFANYSAFVAKKLKGQAIAYEVWNEWKSSPKAGGGNTTYKDYQVLLKATAKAIKAANPQAIVVGDGAPMRGLRPMDSVLVDCGRNKTCAQKNAALKDLLSVVDGMTVHPYPAQYGRFKDNRSGAIDFMVERLRKLETSLAGVSGRTVPLFLTEYGWHQNALTGLTPQLQADLVAETTRKIKELDFVKFAAVYELRDSCVDYTNPECTFGLMTAKKVDKPVFESFSRVIKYGH